MPTRYDVVVIGAGIAGTAAALAASRHARVCVYTRAPGATALFSGAWRGPCPPELLTALQSVGYDLAPVEHPLPHPQGFLSTADYATSSHRAAQLSDNGVVCSISGFAGFNARGLAMQWSALSGFDLGAASITIPETPKTGWATASLAAHIARNPDALRDALARLRAARIILPAVLGKTKFNADFILGEALGSAPSLPGWRLHNALERVLENANVDIVRTGDRPEAGAYVLASGKFLSGGIEADGSFREPVFDCPIWIEHLDAMFEEPDSLMLTDAVRTEEQPLMAAGVQTDDEHRPVNRVGDVVHQNVFVAGSIRAGWTSATHGIGECAQDGWNAGMRAIQK
ncbi:MAG TPA: FAD-binding protein [Longimicrobiales bacterium]|nr:FAD-binding protein [Longimicrobiales bacterium]